MLPGRAGAPARCHGDEVPRQIGRAFNKVASPAFGILVVTGLWNLFEVSLTDRPTWCSS